MTIGKTTRRRGHVAVDATSGLAGRTSRVGVWGRSAKPLSLALLLAAAVAAGGCLGEGGSALLAAEQCPAVGASEALSDGAALAAPAPPVAREEAPPAGGTASRGAGLLPAGPLFQPLLGSGSDAHSARCDPFDDPFGACI